MSTEILRIIATTALISCVGLFNGCGPSELSTQSLNDWIGEGTAEVDFKIVDGIESIEFPYDHGPHTDYMIEWWYLTSIVENEQGEEFGVQFTVFRRGLTTLSDDASPWRSGQIYLAHTALSDVSRAKHYDFERLSRGHPELAGVSTRPFRAFVEDWSLASETGSFFPLNLTVSTPTYRVDFNIESGKPAVLHGEKGYSQKSGNHASYYYSMTQLPTHGSLTLHGEPHSITGNSWIEREWSSQLLGSEHRGWYWFGLSLEDDRDLVLFSLVGKDDAVDALPTLIWIDKEGHQQPLAASNWEINPVRVWQAWPVEWNLRVEQVEYTIKAKFDDQEMGTDIQYWEGVVDVIQDGSSVGRGYMELTGYAD